MKNICLIVLLLIVAGSCKNNKDQKQGPGTPAAKIDSTLVTDSSWGPINRDADLSALERMYGKANTRDEWICGPECADTILVTKIFPDQVQEITVYWDDSAFHKRIMMLEVFRDGNPYHTVHGLKNGSTLNDLLKVNGQKITFSGFSWDYGGFIQSFNGGILESSPIRFRLEYQGNNTGLDGDIELNTDMPNVKQALDSIRNYYLSLSFRKD